MKGSILPGDGLRLFVAMGVDGKSRCSVAVAGKEGRREAGKQGRNGGISASSPMS